MKIARVIQAFWPDRSNSSAQLDVVGTTNLNGDVSVGGTLGVGTITAGTIHFPDGSVQTSAAIPRSRMEIALLRWYEADETGATF